MKRTNGPPRLFVSSGQVEQLKGMWVTRLTEVQTWGRGIKFQRPEELRVHTVLGVGWIERVHFEVHEDDSRVDKEEVRARRRSIEGIAQPLLFKYLARNPFHLWILRLSTFFQYTCQINLFTTIIMSALSFPTPLKKNHLTNHKELHRRTAGKFEWLCIFYPRILSPSPSPWFASPWELTLR